MVHKVQFAPPVIDDQKITETLVKSMAEAVGKQGVATADALSKQAMKSNQLKLEIQEPSVVREDSVAYIALNRVCTNGLKDSGP